MANPVAYYNTRSYAISVGGWSVPANKLVIFHADTMNIYIAGSGISTAKTITQANLNAAVNSGDLKLAYGSANAIQLYNNVSCGTYSLSSGVLGTGYIWGYKFKLRNAAKVYSGTTARWTIPAGAHVIVAGNSTVGSSYKHRLAIAGIEMTYSQAKNVSGYPMVLNGNVWHAIHRLDTNYYWWIDLGANTDAKSTRSTVNVQF